MDTCKAARAVLVILGVAVTGCVGTDTIADPQLLVPPRLELAPETTALQIGQQIRLQAVYHDEHGDRPSGLAIFFASADSTIVSVDESSLLSAQRQGQVGIVATVAGVSDSVLVTVVEDMTTQIAVVRVSPASASLSIGDTLQFGANGLNAGGQQLSAGGFSWSSSDTAIVQIDAAGQAIAITSGTASIRAATDGIQSAEIRLTIMGHERLGSFFGVAGHDAVGTARLAPGLDGELRLSFAEDFLVDQGPQLAVFLSPGEQFGPGSINLGELQSPRGPQIYVVPGNAGLGTLDWVIIHCVPYNISFGRARLE